MRYDVCVCVCECVRVCVAWRLVAPRTSQGHLRLAAATNRRRRRASENYCFLLYDMVLLLAEGLEYIDKIYINCDGWPTTWRTVSNGGCTFVGYATLWCGVLREKFKLWLLCLIDCVISTVCDVI